MTDIGPMASASEFCRGTRKQTQHCGVGMFTEEKLLRGNMEGEFWLNKATAEDRMIKYPLGAGASAGQETCSDSEDGAVHC